MILLVVVVAINKINVQQTVLVFVQWWHTFQEGKDVRSGPSEDQED